MIDQWVAGPVAIGPLAQVEAENYYNRIAYLLSDGYTVQFKAGRGAVFCLIYTGGLDRRMVAIESGSSPAVALAGAMGKAGLLSKFNQQVARG